MMNSIGPNTDPCGTPHTTSDLRGTAGDISPILFIIINFITVIIIIIIIIILLPRDAHTSIHVCVCVCVCVHAVLCVWSAAV